MPRGLIDRVRAVADALALARNPVVKVLVKLSDSAFLLLARSMVVPTLPVLMLKYKSSLPPGIVPGLGVELTGSVDQFDKVAQGPDVPTQYLSAA
jgi:hypothetical protein